LVAAGPSLCLLAATNYLAFNVASVPLLWALPLGIYLSTFILAFRGKPLPPALYACLLAGLLILIAPAVLVNFPAVRERAQDLILSLVVLTGIALDLMGLFIFSLICHRSLADHRPAKAGAMPTYYLCVALGGSLGGLVSVLLPVVASRWPGSTLEWALGGLVCMGAVLFRDRVKLSELWRRSGLILKAVFGFSAAFVGLGLLTAMLRGELGDRRTIHARRNYYGICRVTEKGDQRQFLHGNTIHGMQYTDDRMRRFPLGYYHPRTPFGQLFARFGPLSKSVGVVGLGAGSMAAFGEPGQEMDFYELDPDVGAIAEQYFTFLKETKAKVNLIYGDARLSLAGRLARYDLLILDAFSSDAVPIHLLTREAFEVYLARLAPKGLLACHVSNRLFDLKPVVAATAAPLGLKLAYKAKTQPEDEDEYPTVLVVMARETEKLQWLVDHKGWRWLEPPKSGRPKAWTDDYASILSLIFP
jgi:spermidine synthase